MHAVVIGESEQILLSKKQIGPCLTWLSALTVSYLCKNDQIGADGLVHSNTDVVSANLFGKSLCSIPHLWEGVHRAHVACNKHSPNQTKF